MKTLEYLKGMMPQYKENLTLTIPVVLSQAGQIAVQLIDNAMVGRLGAVPLAAVSFGNAIFSIFMMWGIGLSMGLTPLVGEAYAQREHRNASAFFQNSILLYSGAGIALFLVLYTLGAFMGNMGQPDEVVEQAKPYFHFLAWSIVPFMVFTAFKQFLEGIGNTKTAMIVVLTANAVNVIFNYIFIYGNWGAPAMGAAGAGLATFISRMLMPVLIIIYFIYNNSARRYFKFFSMSRQAWQWTKQLLKVGLPISVQVLLEISTFALTLIMMGWIGTHELAAHQIVVSCSNFTFTVFVGVSSATTIMVSHQFGIKNFRELRKAAIASYHIGITLVLLFMTCFILLRNQISGIFTNDPTVLHWAAQLFIIAGLYQLADGMQVISLGILRGMQDVKITMKYAFISYILINLPVGYFCAFILGMGPIGLWLGFIVGLGIAAILLFRRYKKMYRIFRLKSISENISNA